MRRRLIQLLVVLIAAGAVIGTPAPAEAGWCVEFYACEPTGPCSEEPTKSDYYRYYVCCDTYGNCEDGDRTWISCC